MLTFRLQAAVVVALLPVTGTVRADTIYLRGGEKLIGKVVSDEKAKVVIKSQALGRLEIPRERIERIELDPPPAAQPANPAAGQPFVPPAPVAATQPTNAPVATTTNAPSKRSWFWGRKTPTSQESTDWIQLKSGEWLRGWLYGMQNRKLEFESDELDDLVFDWKDVHQVISPQVLVSYGDRESTWGALRADRENITVTGVKEVKFPRYDLIGIAPGSPRELDYWSGRFNVGLNLRSGNTEQADFVSKIKLERRTPRTHLKLEYIGNYSSVSQDPTIDNHQEPTIDNQRATESFDYFLTRRLFVRVPYAEYYRDPFQNIEHRLTAGGGVGYYFIDRPNMEWLVSGGPAYQIIRFETERRSTPAFVLQSNFEVDLTKRLDLELGYQAIAANDDSGGITHHWIVTLEFDITRRLDLDISFIWDRIGTPQADSAGDVPKKDDFRLNLSLGVKF